jgi:hypothetical protein
MKRRRFLVGLGGIAVGLPMLRRFLGPTSASAATAGAGAPRRIIAMAYPMGTHIPMWAPAATGGTFDLPPITASLEPFKDRLLLVSRLPNAVLDLGGNAYVYGHPAKKESAFTGTLMQHAFTGDGSNHIDNVIAADPEGQFRTPNGPSVEQFIGDALRGPEHLRPSVDLGIWGGGGTREAEPSDFFYEAAANPVTMSAHPGLAFASLFNGVNPDGEPDEAFLALQRRKKSVLDAVRDSFVDLRQGLDARDRQILDEHADKIRQIELDMPPLASCTIPSDVPEGDGPYAGLSMMELADFQNRLMAHAMGCSLAPIGRIEYLDQQNPFFGIPAIDDVVATVQDWHHPIVHAADGWPENDPTRVAGFTFFVDKFADLLAQLDAIVEGPDGETVLDNSLVVLGSDLAEGGGHGAFDLCYAVVGGGAGRRQFHFDGSNHNTNHFLTSLVQMACVTNDDGSPIQQFGLQGFVNGPIDAILA